MLVNAVLQRPEGAAIHQPRAAPWEPVIRRERKPCKQFPGRCPIGVNLKSIV